MQEKLENNVFYQNQYKGEKTLHCWQDINGLQK